MEFPSLSDHLHLDPPVATYMNPSAHNDQGVNPADQNDQDLFTFRLHNLGHSDVVLFYSIIFNNVRRNLTWHNLTWHNDEALKIALEEYLENDKFLLPVRLAFFKGNDEIEKMVDVKRRRQLHKLLTRLKAPQGKATGHPVPSVSSHVQGMSPLRSILNLMSPRCP